jgi:hypothetical protein
MELIADSHCIHIWSEILSNANIPRKISPPSGSLLDYLFKRYHLDYEFSNIDSEVFETLLYKRDFERYRNFFLKIHKNKIYRWYSLLDRLLS